MSDAFVRALARAAAARYPRAERFARHFASGKLKGDPVFAHLLRAGLFPDGASVADLGCGQGLLGAWLHAARDSHGRGDWPGDWAPPPRVFRLYGLERSARDVERARSAGGPGCEYVVADLRTHPFGTADVVVLLDVLHYMVREEQKKVLEGARAALAGGGTLLLRVADNDGSLRFRVTEWADSAAVLLRGSLPGRLHSRPLREWLALLESLGFAVEMAPMSAGTPFANALLVARYHRPRNGTPTT